MDLLRFATAGSVDDGKSTLIGRMLYDTKTAFTDQLESVERVSRDRGDDYTDLALLTDGLRAEREQGITIDVAYRYFATPRRSFVLADTPGHVQYTRNMVTGASTADVAVVLVDARKGLVEQSRRHASIAALLRVRHVVLAVNKMDLVGFAEDVFDEVCADFAALAERRGFAAWSAVPVCALHGDNVVDRSGRTPWYGGPPLLEHLETLEVAAARAENGDTRFPVQLVIRPRTAAHPDYRGYAGRVEAGTLRVGDPVVVLPSGLGSTVAGIDTADGPLSEAPAGRSVVVRLADDVDVS
ncbi:MAG TPA: GTP-binding protein, partial [Kribbellaceae bacterium]|nr:GTP-binding protein [Kribbellaceae bacterium]